MHSRQAVQPGRLQIRSFFDGSTQVLLLSGELDTSGCAAVESELLRIESESAQRIVVDLMDLNFIDSTGIALLVAAMRRSEQDSGRLRFIPSESEDVRRLLQLCGLEARMPFVQDGTSN
jgi:anti-sigma B factor antagonist